MVLKHGDLQSILRDNHAINRFYLEFTHILTSYLLVTASSNWEDSWVG